MAARQALPTMAGVTPNFGLMSPSNGMQTNMNISMNANANQQNPMAMMNAMNMMNMNNMGMGVNGMSMMGMGMGFPMMNMGMGMMPFGNMGGMMNPMMFGAPVTGMPGSGQMHDQSSPHDTKQAHQPAPP
jgi:hypothetical protein